MTQAQRDAATTPYLGHLLYEIQIIGKTCGVVC
jgi:hypothetical protein